MNNRFKPQPYKAKPKASLDTLPQAPPSLFPPFSISGNIITAPVASYHQDSTVQVFWGSSTGYIYSLDISQTTVSLDSFQTGNSPISYLHLNADKNIISVGSDGSVYIDGTFYKNSELPVSRPVGDRSAGVTRDGKFLLFESEDPSPAEEGIYRFDSPMITRPNSANTQYFVTGKNKLFNFNYNFTIADDFPVKLNDPDVDLTLPISPLFNRFFNASANQTDGVLVTDPSGILDGFDLQGGRLDDFPLAVGDSILVTPAILDIDSDGDLELSVISTGGLLNVYDLMSDYQNFGWNQLYYDELNSNRNNNTVIPVQPLLPAGTSQLLPEKMVYNWPNPNIDNYTFIRYFLSDEAAVDIKIYDMAGDLVEELTGTGNGNTANEVRWDLGTVQSGVYFARIEAQSANKSEVRIIKIAVVK